MTAEAHLSFTTPIARTPAAVRAALPERQRQQFDAEWSAALDEARTSFDLTALQSLVGGWWAVAMAQRSPDTAEALALGRRWRAGEDVGAVPSEQVLPRRA